MAEKEADYERKPLLNEQDNDQLTEEKSTEEQLHFTIPPPAYEPLIKPAVLPVEYKPEYKPEVNSAMPLPTYDQSEKYEKEGVLELGNTNDAGRFDGTINIFTRQTDQPNGSWGEFTLFFVVCLLFSWVGYVFACCLAVTIAAQSGAAAGLGMSLIVKTVFIEFQPSYLTHMVQNMCSDQYYYDGENYSSGCSTRSYNFLKLMFWIMGFLGLFLFARGLSVFCRTRGNRSTTPTRS